MTPDVRSQPVPSDPGEYELEIEAIPDVYLSVGQPPNPAKEPRELILGGDTALVSAEPGDRLAWLRV